MSLIKVNQKVLDQLAKDARIVELKQLLANTDYVGLSDYDKEKPELIAERGLWRAEIRELEREDESPSPEVENVQVSSLEGEDDAD